MILKTSARSVLAVISAGVVSCATPAPDALTTFPIGIYGVRKPEQLGEIRRLGFDAFYAEPADFASLDGLAREARRQGMSMLAQPTNLLNIPASKTKKWPIAAWYLQDEPDVAGTSPAQLAGLSSRVKNWDPGRRQTFVIGKADAAERFASIGDLLMLDWYPVPHLRLESVGQQLDAALHALPGGKRAWMVLQAFDWRDYPQHDPSKPRIGRFPDRDEIRFMTYLAILHGARGLYFFTLDKPGGKTLFDFPEQFQALINVVREIVVLKPVFERGKLIPLPFPSDPDGVEARAWRHDGHAYVIILCAKGESPCKLSPELSSGSWRPLFEVRRDPRDLLVNRPDGIYLPPRRVMVFEGS